MIVKLERDPDRLRAASAATTDESTPPDMATTIRRPLSGSAS